MSEQNANRLRKKMIANGWTVERIRQLPESERHSIYTQHSIIGQCPFNGKMQPFEVKSLKQYRELVARCD